MGRRVPGVTGGPVQGLEAYVAFREGFQAEPGTERDTVFKEMVNELGILAQEQGQTRAQQIVFLEQQGFGFEGARAIIGMREEVKKGTSVEEAFEKRRDDFRNTAKTEAQKQSGYQRALVKAQHAVQQIGSGILTLLITGFSALIKSLQLGVAYLAGSDEDKILIKKELAALTKATDTGLNQTIAGFEKLKDVGVGITKFTVKMPGRGKPGDGKKKPGPEKTIEDLEAELEAEESEVGRHILRGQIGRRKEQAAAKAAADAAEGAKSLAAREELRRTGGLGPAKPKVTSHTVEGDVSEEYEAHTILKPKKKKPSKITRRPKPAPRGRAAD
jgi:hypothetical protein